MCEIRIKLKMKSVFRTWDGRFPSEFRFELVCLDYFGVDNTFRGRFGPVKFVRDGGELFNTVRDELEQNTS